MCLAKLQMLTLFLLQLPLRLPTPSPPLPLLSCIRSRKKFEYSVAAFTILNPFLPLSLSPHVSLVSRKKGASHSQLATYYYHHQLKPIILLPAHLWISPSPYKVCLRNNSLCKKGKSRERYDMLLQHRNKRAACIEMYFLSPASVHPFVTKTFSCKFSYYYIAQLGIYVTTVYMNNKEMLSIWTCEEKVWLFCCRYNGKLRSWQKKKREESMRSNKMPISENYSRKSS